MSKIEVDAITEQSGTTLTTGGGAGKTVVVDATTVTLGRCGGTVALASGASQTGFGRTGTVDWQTGSIKTSTFTAANGEGYFANTSGGAFTMNLPAGSAGAIVSVADYTNTFQTNGLTISPNGAEKIGGVAADFVAAVEGQSLTFVYVDGTEGWKNIQDSTSNAIGNPNLVATGGTITTCGNCKIHTFTGPGTFTVSAAASCAADNVVSYLVIAGGGSGGSADRGGGGGAGGYRELVSPSSPYSGSPLNGYPNAPNRVTVTATAFPITVGSGANSNPYPQKGNNGNVSTFSTITSAGGGAGGSAPGGNAAQAGGSGGAGGVGGGCVTNPGGAGNTPPVSPPQGNNGGSGQHCGNGGSGGGGGAGAVGGNGVGNPPGTGAPGGAGVTSSITGSPVTRAGGGGGLGDNGPKPGGAGGGGAGSPYPTGAGGAGTINTGSGGGGGGSPGPSTTGGLGGSGIVVIRYKFQ